MSRTRMHTKRFVPRRLASGATWQSSGQVSHLQNTLIETHFAKYSKELYERLHKEGHDIGMQMDEPVILDSLCV